VLCISPEVATNLVFETPLPTGTVEVQATAQEIQVGHVQRFVVLLPSVRLLPGEWRKLTVLFGDGAAPAMATLWLYVHPALGARQVEVKRRGRTVESYQREAQALKEETRRYQEENAQLRAAQGKPEGLRGVLSGGLVEEGGIAYANLTKLERYTVRKGSALKPIFVRSYRSPTRVAVKLRLKLLVEEAWEAEGAALVDAQGRTLLVLPLWQEADPDGNWLEVIVEAEAARHEAQGPYTLKLWEAGGPRGLTLEGVVFPVLLAGLGL
jgi:uncharacterized protein (TIGR02268 family)